MNQCTFIVSTLEIVKVFLHSGFEYRVTVSRQSITERGEIVQFRPSVNGCSSVGQIKKKRKNVEIGLQVINVTECYSHFHVYIERRTVCLSNTHQWQLLKDLRCRNLRLQTRLGAADR